MPWPESPLGGVNTDLSRLVAAAADLCRKPLRHGVVALGAPDPEPGTDSGADQATDLCLRLETRSPEGERTPAEDLELEIYRSGGELNLTLSWAEGEERPLLWQGSHPVWMDGCTGVRCGCPTGGAPLEALARRLRALLRDTQD